MTVFDDMLNEALGKKKPTPKVTEEAVIKFINLLMKQGKIIEAGWMGLKIAAINPEAGPIQLKETRMAFFAGAAHLFSSMMVGLDEGDDVTEPDVHQLNMIDAELREFIESFKKEYSVKEPWK